MLCRNLLGAAIGSALLAATLGANVAFGQAGTTTTTTTTTGGATGAAGVEIDPSGVFRVKVIPDPGGRVAATKAASAKASSSSDVFAVSELRKVSLTRLEKAVAARVAAGEEPTEEMKACAGLRSVEYLLLYPETGDVVIAGPAGGFASDAAGRMRSLVDGSSVIELRDVVTALRAYPPSSPSTPVISVSIDPTPEGLARMQAFLAKVGTTVTPAMTEELTRGLRESLGNQKITIQGVSAKTHFAEVLVEADYRMKLIGIGLEAVPPAVKIPSYTSATRPGEGSKNALQRWFFTPSYDGLVVNEDRSALELSGQSVQLVGVNEMVGKDGERAAAGGESRASKIFTTAFTKEYAKLAALAPVYDQLQDLVDLAVAAAFLQENDWYGKADWTMETFGSEETLGVENGTAPTEVGTAVNAIWRGRSLMTPIGGGVNIQPTKAVSAEHVKTESNGEVSSVKAAIDAAAVPANRWWWD